MGNEHSKKKEPSKEQTHPRSENGGVHGLAVNTTSSGVDINVNSETPTQPNGKPAAIDPAVEPPQEPDFAVIVSADEPVEVAPERPREEDEQPQDKKVHLFDKLFKKKADLEAKVDADIVHEEEKTKNDETDLSLPDANTQLESNLSGEKADAIFEPIEESDCPHHKAESSTQTDGINGADDWTPTGDEGKPTLTTNLVVATDPSKEPSDYDIIIAEEAVEEGIQEQLLDNKAPGLLTKKITVENISNEFRAKKQVVMDDVEAQNPEKTDPEVTTKCILSKSITDMAEEVKVEGFQDGESSDDMQLTEMEHDVVMRDIRNECDISVMETISEEEEHGILEPAEPTVNEEAIIIAQSDIVLEEPLEICDTYEEELSTIDEVPEDHFDEVVSEMNSTDDCPVGGKRTTEEIQVEKIGAFPQNPECPEPSTHSHLEVIHSKKSRAVQELSSECEVLKAPVEALVDVPCSESLHRYPAIPAEETTIPAKHEECKQEEVLGSVDEDAPNQEFSAECESTEISEGIVEGPECYGLVNGNVTVLEPPVEEIVIPVGDDTHYKDCTQNESNTTIQVSVSESPGENSTVGEVSESCKAQISEDNPATSEKPEEEKVRPCDDKGVDAIETIVETLSENLAVCESMTKENCGVQAEPPTEKELGSESFVQDNPAEENINQSEEAQFLGSPLAPQSTVLKTNTVLEEPNKCDNCLAASECLRVVIEGVLGKNTTDKTTEAESSEMRPTEGSSDQSKDHQEHMEALLVGLQSSCTSVVEESSYKLENFEISSLGCKITVVIQVSPLEGRQ
ncbi:breast carcinoma-amplified sequence 1 isoform X1 [Nerophis lumbriciformis]|uniref:breast carcinoma-amplified sequence 1 isoform X1 n=1 Tax=Nerophis lumbriciformis TaxID=546530 RepID=UPI002AE081C7|nr:breast carcinoma-amplified sequence 1 isoform X1 [Nerophis lumbriciformis]